MKADLSRNTFDRKQHYSGVRLQQGRIVTDADWNEQADIERYRAERQALDTIGPCGGPLDGAGYGLVAETNALAVQALDAKVALIVAEDGVLLRTENGGTNWTLVDVETAAHLRAISIAGNTGWVVGDGGVVQKTNDGGKSWGSQSPGTLQSLRGVAAVDEINVWAVGDGGIVISSKDGGVSWNLVQTEAARLYAVDFADAYNGIAVGQGGVILKTIDGGETWSCVMSGSSAHLRALTRVGATHIWVVGQGGTILRSVDGGLTWLPSSYTKTSATLHAIAFLDKDKGWAVGEVGEVGIVLHSDDGGATWLDLESKRPTPFRGLSIIEGKQAGVVGARTWGKLNLPLDNCTFYRLPAYSISIKPGRYYVDGMLCELEARCSYANQAEGGAGERLKPGDYLLYLDAWQRHISALEAPVIREVALGGPDTATRARTIAHVRALSLPEPVADQPDWNCESSIKSWDALINKRRPRLAARAQPQLAAGNLCETASRAGYRRLENQLYRVEVHEGGASPSFKWSRENASIAYAVVSVSIDIVMEQTTVRVAERGRDANLDIAVGDRVELIDDDAELSQRAGTLFEYLSDGDDELELVLAGIPEGAIGQDPSRHPVLRRWDHKPRDASKNVLPIVENTWIDLEDGVQVRFRGKDGYRPGDYWQIPARTLTADVEWPHNDNGDPSALAPAGILDAYCRLAIVHVYEDGTHHVTSDCRELFPPLTELKQLLYVSGDGQDAAPGTKLEQPLMLRVSRGGAPFLGARVRFKVIDGLGQVKKRSGSSWKNSVEIDTNTDGIAICKWKLGSSYDPRYRYQRVFANLLGSDGSTIYHQLIVFCATATAMLQYIGGDGQQGAGGEVLPNKPSFRVTSGGHGVKDVRLVLAVEGGGSITNATGTSSDTPPPYAVTNSDGYASFDWKLGISGKQQVTVNLIGDDNTTVLQHLDYIAEIAQPASRGTGCAITIGRGGQHESLNSKLLSSLLDDGGGQLCLCFMPGTHILAGLDVVRRQVEGHHIANRLSLRSCGPTAILNVSEDIRLEGFDLLEMRDLVISMNADKKISFNRTKEIRLEGINITIMLVQGQPASEKHALLINNAEVVNMTGCRLGPKEPQPLAVFQRITNCLIEGSRFDGRVSFYGIPGSDPSKELIKVLSRSESIGANVGAALAAVAAASQTVNPQVWRMDGNGRLNFVNNSVELLTIAEEVATTLVKTKSASFIFQTAVLQGNTFGEGSHVFVSKLLSVGGNSFVGDRSLPYAYGVMVGIRAAAAGNVAVNLDDNAILYFLHPDDGGFSGAANQIYTLPKSSP